MSHSQEIKMSFCFNHKTHLWEKKKFFWFQKKVWKLKNVSCVLVFSVKNAKLSCPFYGMVVHLIYQKAIFEQTARAKKGGGASTVLADWFNVFFFCIIKAVLQGHNKYNASRCSCSLLFLFVWTTIQFNSTRKCILSVERVDGCLTNALLLNSDQSAFWRKL